MSLTKKALLDAVIAQTDKPHELGEFFGQVIHVKKMSEVRRTRRAASMFDKDGEIQDKYRERARLYTIIDHVCNEEGELIFTEKDVASLQEAQADVLDSIVEAITDWAAGYEGNE